jgi:site-specific recombinase XerD
MAAIKRNLLPTIGGNMNFEAWLMDRGLSGKTVRGYVDDMAIFADWFLEENHEPLTPVVLTPTDIRAYRDHMKAGRSKPASINRRLAAIRAWCAWSVDTGQAASNAAAAIQGMRQQQPAPRWLDRKAQAKLLREIERDIALARTPPAIHLSRRNLTIVTLLLHTGLRVNELCQLEIADVTLTERSGKIRVRHGKGEKEREVQLNATARAALRAWLDLVPPICHLFGALCDRSVRHMLGVYGRRAGVPVSPHILRHTFAKNLVDSGVPIDQVAALLGHEKLETTRRYTLPGELDLERAVARLDI